MYTTQIYIQNICVYRISVMFIVIVIIIIGSFSISILFSILKFLFYQFRKENFYPIKTEDQSTFIRETILHCHDWRKTEIDKSKFIGYVKRHSKADKKSGLIVHLITYLIILCIISKHILLT